MIWIKKGRISESVRDYKITRGIAIYSIGAATIAQYLRAHIVIHQGKK